jgi:RNA polymerase-interacting CarD/CdnL/TRCF family regulator
MNCIVRPCLKTKENEQTRKRNRKDYFRVITIKNDSMIIWVPQSRYSSGIRLKGLREMQDELSVRLLSLVDNKMTGNNQNAHR